MSYIQGNVNGFVMQSTPVEPIKTPSGVLVTRSVETKAGWVGQILVDKEIIWESKPGDDSKDAVREANDRVLSKLRRMFAA